MEYLVLQISAFLILAVTAGLALGWWSCKFVYSGHSADCQHELSGLRRNYEDIVKENATLRLQLRHVEKALQKLSSASSDTAYGEFIETRKKLEATRCQYENLLERLHQQEKTLGILRTQLQTQQQEIKLQKQADTNQNITSDVKSTALSVAYKPENEQNDDLTLIQGINQKLAGKLQALGIITYRQIAEFTKDDICSIQRIIGADINLPFDEWAHTARSLFQEKYSQPQA